MRCWQSEDALKMASAGLRQSQLVAQDATLAELLAQLAEGARQALTVLQSRYEAEQQKHETESQTAAKSIRTLEKQLADAETEHVRATGELDRTINTLQLNMNYKVEELKKAQQQIVELHAILKQEQQEQQIFDLHI